MICDVKIKRWKRKRREKKEEEREKELVKDEEGEDIEKKGNDWEKSKI